MRIGLYGQRIGFILFNISDKPDSYIDAQLIIKITTMVTNTSLDVDVYAVPNISWTETTLTWNNKPNYTELIDTFHIEYDVWVSGPPSSTFQPAQLF